MRRLYAAQPFLKFAVDSLGDVGGFLGYTPCMHFLLTFFSALLHLDVVLGSVIQRIGPWSYVLLFLVIFCETGLVVMPFLPGDSLLFAAGAFAALGSLNLIVLYVVLIAAAILGDTLNYALGYKCGVACLSNHVLNLKPEHIEQTQRFYDRHGGKAIFYSRFVPIVRTLAPFVSGIGRMSYQRFLSYNVIGATVWVGLFLTLGYFFGTVPSVKENFSLVLLAIIVVTAIPPAIEVLRQRQSAKKVV